jgi:hypothetical protein
MNILGKIVLTALVSIGNGLAWAGTSNGAFTQVQSVPTLDEWGLIGLIAAVGVVGGLAIRKRKKK